MPSTRHDLSERSRQTPTGTSGPTPSRRRRLRQPARPAGPARRRKGPRPRTPGPARPGVRSTQSSKRRITVQAGAARPVSFHSIRTWCRSASVAKGSSDKGRSGSRTPASRRARRCRPMRSMVVRSKRSEAYWKPPTIRPSNSPRARVRSNLAAPLCTASGESVRPGRFSDGRAAFCTTSITWNSGVWLRLRSGCSSSTSRSNGTSWWA